MRNEIHVADEMPQDNSDGGYAREKGVAGLVLI